MFPLSEGVRPSESRSKGLSFLHSLTRSSREHLRSGKDRKTAGFMVTPGFAAGTGQGWVGLGKGWAPGAGGSGQSSRQRHLVLWTRSSSGEHPGQLPERPRTPSLPGPAHLGAYWEMWSCTPLAEYVIGHPELLSHQALVPSPPTPPRAGSCGIERAEDDEPLFLEDGNYNSQREVRSSASGGLRRGFF